MTVCGGLSLWPYPQASGSGPLGGVPRRSPTRWGQVINIEGLLNNVRARHTSRNGEPGELINAQGDPDRGQVVVELREGTRPSDRDQRGAQTSGVAPGQ